MPSACWETKQREKETMNSVSTTIIRNVTPLLHLCSSCLGWTGTSWHLYRCVFKIWCPLQTPCSSGPLHSLVALYAAWNVDAVVNAGAWWARCCVNVRQMKFRPLFQHWWIQWRFMCRCQRDEQEGGNKVKKRDGERGMKQNYLTTRWCSARPELVCEINWSFGPCSTFSSMGALLAWVHGHLQSSYQHRVAHFPFSRFWLIATWMGILIWYWQC